MVDVFTRQIYGDEFINSLRYCQKEKGLEVLAWVVKSNHCHLILRATRDNSLSDIIRDIKRHTSKSIYRCVKDNVHESRKSWLLKVLSYEMRIWFWKEGSREEILSTEFFQTRA